MAAGGSKGRGRPPAKRPPAKAAGARKSTTRKPASGARQQREARALRTRLIVGAALLVVAGAVVFFAARPGSGPSTEEQLTAGAGACTFDTERDGDAANQGDHVPNPTYEVDPPAGGPHNPQAANPGFYTGSRVPSDGQLVHAMEHGFVILWYRPDVPAETMTELEQLSDRFGRELIVAPRPSLEGEVAVTAWHRRLLCGELVPEKVATFTDAFKDKGPEKGFL